MRGGGVIICSASLASFCPAATGAFGALRKPASSTRRGEPVRRLGFAGPKIFQMLQLGLQAAEMPAQFGHGLPNGVAQDLRRRLGAQIDDELTSMHGCFQG